MLSSLSIFHARVHRQDVLFASVASGLLVVAGGCSDSDTNSPPVVQTDSAGVQQLSLRGDFLSGETWQRLDPLWEVGAGTEGIFVDITAATRTAQGSFAVLDRFNRAITLVGSEGQVLSTFGREGDGPSEFQDPRDIVALDRQLIVWDLRQTRFQVFDDSGKFIRDARLPEPGDIAGLTGRIDLELDDLSRRMETTPATRAVFFQVEDNERELISPKARGTEDVQRSGFVVAYDSTLSTADTLISFIAPPRSLSPGTPSYGPPIFSAQHMWDVGMLGLLHGSNGASHVSLVDFSGRLLSELRWESKRRPTSPDDRLAHVISFYREQSPYLPSEVREQWDGNTAMQKRAAEHIAVADSVPVFSRIWLAGRCAALSPFDPEDASDGTAQRVVLVNLEDAAVVGRIAFGESGTDRILWLSSSAVLTKHIDSFGVQSLHYFAFPEDVRRICQI